MVSASFALLSACACFSALAQQSDSVAAPVDPTPVDATFKPAEVKQKLAVIVTPEALPSKIALSFLTSALQFKTSSSETVRMSGVLSLDHIDGVARPIVGSPAPQGAGAPGLVGNIIADAIIQKMARDSREKAARIESELIVAPFASIILLLRKTDLIDRSIALITKELSDSARAANKSEPETAVDSFEFEYRLNQDKRTWMLDMASTPPIQTDRKAAPYVVKTIRVIGRQLPESVDTAQMLEDNGKLLRQELHGLLAEAMTIANSKLSPESYKNTPETTVRFSEAGRARFERGILLGQDCSRVIMQTLRGWILSAPSASEPIDASCTTAGK